MRPRPRFNRPITINRPNQGTENLRVRGWVLKILPPGWQKTWAAKDGGRKGKRSMPGSERTAAAKEVDAVFSTVAEAETRGSGGEGGERRQRATGVGDNRVDGRLGGGDGGSVRTRRRDQWRETATFRPWRQQKTASKEKEAADDAGRGRRGDGGEEAVRKQGKKAPVARPLRRREGNREEGRRRKRPRSMAATASSEAGTGGLMKTETRPTATEKSEGREDPHVVGDGKEEEGERDSGGDEVCRGSGNSITEEKGGGV